MTPLGSLCFGSSVSSLAITPRELVCPVRLDIVYDPIGQKCLVSRRRVVGEGTGCLEGKDRVTIS